MDPLGKWWTGRSKSFSKTNSLSFTSFSDVFLYQVRICLYNWGTDMFSTEWFYDATWTLCEAKNHEFPAIILRDATFFNLLFHSAFDNGASLCNYGVCWPYIYTNIYIYMYTIICVTCLLFCTIFVVFLCLIFGAAWVLFSSRFVLSDFCIEVAPLGDWLHSQRKGSAGESPTKNSSIKSLWLA